MKIVLKQTQPRPKGPSQHIYQSIYIGRYLDFYHRHPVQCSQYLFDMRKLKHMIAQRLVILSLTHRDYGPIGVHTNTGFFPALSARRLNIAYPRGEIIQRASAI